jgi:hypothetical protein
MLFSWVRPESAEFPLNYSNFQALDDDGESTTNYRIEDLQQNRFDEVIKLMSEKHLRDEPMYSSKKVSDCPQSMKEMTENWRNMLNQKVSLVCYKEGSDEIIAVNVLGVVTEAEADAPHNVRRTRP